VLGVRRFALDAFNLQEHVERAVGHWRAGGHDRDRGDLQKLGEFRFHFFQYESGAAAVKKSPGPFNLVFRMIIHTVASMAEPPNPYNEIAYAATPQPQAHPDRLAALGILFGLEVAPVETSRILELGCGDGSNLIPQAAVFKNASVVGIDLSSAAISKAKGFAQACDLKNITLIEGDISQPGGIQGEFDYIICHGVYSWAPPHVREAILRICREHLSERGLALISYNALPGWNLRLGVRQMLFWHMRQIDKPDERLEEGRVFAQFLGEHLADETPSGVAMRREFQAAVEKIPRVFFHDELSQENQPFYFHEFMSAASAHELQFVAEPDLFEYLAPPLKPEALRLLNEVAADRLEREQYLDFLITRRFRQTILCRAARAVSEKPIPEKLCNAFFAASDDTERSSDSNPAQFIRPNGPRLTTNFAPGIAAFERLLSERPRRLHFSELSENVTDEAGLLRFLFEASSGKFVTFHATAPDFVFPASEKPVAFVPARFQAAAGLPVTTVHHLSIDLQELWVREVVTGCDGSRTKSELTPNLSPTQRDELFARLAKMPLFVA
jgi:SAM-dependent methyltransferase